MTVDGSSVRVSADTRKAIARLSAAREQSAGKLLEELVAEAERADAAAHKRGADFLKAMADGKDLVDWEVLRTVRETAWRTPPY